MDILVLDAPMKFIHGKMVEHGAREWSRYLASQFNPLGRGTLYSEHFDKSQGLKVYLYSAAITLECVGESKGYLKVVKAEETDVMTYHKVIEEGKLLEEKLTFVPVYKFQYINGKEHHDVEQFLQAEQERRDLQSYINQWKNFTKESKQVNKPSLESQDLEDETLENQSSVKESVVGCNVQEESLEEQVESALKALYTGETAHKDMKNFMPELENLKPVKVREFNSDEFSLHYDDLSDRQKLVLERALSTNDLYFIQNELPEIPLIREMASYITSQSQKLLVVAPSDEKVDSILKDLENECLLEGMRVQSENTDVQELASSYTIEYKVQQMKDHVLAKLEEEASKHNRQKQELDQMKTECELYQKADQITKLCFEILDLLEEINEEKMAIQKESEALGLEGMQYVEALERYNAIPAEEHEIYRKLKVAVGSDQNLYDEMLWMRANEEAIHYQEYKALIMEYSKSVQVFEEKLAGYKKQIAMKKQYEEEYKALEMKLLELRRQYLKTEALKQVDFSGDIETDEAVKNEIQQLEAQILEMKTSKEGAKMGVLSTRHLDELKVQVYELKEKVEAYIAEYQFVLAALYDKEEVTKGEVIDIFKRMQKVEKLFEREEAGTEYLQGLEEYFELEVKVRQNEQLMQRQEANQEKMVKLLKKQQEVESLLSTKLEESEFKAFLQLIEEGKDCTQQICNKPLAKESRELLEKLEAAVQQREFKLQIYKEKVAFYEELAKLKEDWKQSLLSDQEMLKDYLMKQIKVIGATCKDLGLSKDKSLAYATFDYVIIQEAEQMVGLELLLPMIKGKKVILMGNSLENESSLFAKLYEKCPQQNKSQLENLA